MGKATELMERIAKTVGGELTVGSTKKRTESALDARAVVGEIGITVNGRVYHPFTVLADAAEIALYKKVSVTFNTHFGIIHASYGEEPKAIYCGAYFKDYPTEQAAYCWVVCQVLAKIPQDLRSEVI